MVIIKSIIKSKDKLILKKQILKIIATIIKDRGIINEDKYSKMMTEFEKLMT